MMPVEPAQAAGSSLWEAYRPPPEAWDELFSAPGELRPHWRYPIQALDGLGREELARRVREARRLVRDNGVTYTVYGDPDGLSRPWALDLVPYLVTSQEWARVEAGLVQRAELLNLLLADLYGPRETLRRGLLPAELVWSHPGYLRACAGHPVPSARYLAFYAADLARGPDGALWLLADRAQAPSGAGYALENRLVLSRVLPSLYRDAQVHRLATFFRAFRRALAALAPPGQEVPRTVVLTPGPRNEAYFEHAYLAGYLGYTLAQGDDLTVRGERVWLRSLEGLQPVDVVLRRVDDEYCDPLELREDSLLGVPGLVQAVRAGKVTVVNALGSGVLDSPALMQYLPGLARALLGEDLRLPQVETWWCGTPAGLAHVLANLDRLVVKPVRPGRGERSVFAAELDADGRAALRQTLVREPHRYVGQARLRLGTAPVLAGERLEPRHVVVRSFLVGGPGGYLTMPGGLTRVAPREGQLVVSNQIGGAGKDTWVVASEPERQESLLVRVERRAPASRPVPGVPSRVADNLYWVGRYAERAEGLVRLLRVAGELVVEQGSVTGPAEQEGVACLLRAVTHRTGLYPGFVGPGAEERLASAEAELLTVLTERDRPGGLVQSLQALVAAARSVRDRLSGDTWRVVNEVEGHVGGLLGGPRQLVDALFSVESMVGALAAFAGLTIENMRHGQAWRFLELGRRLERAIHTATLLRSALVPALGAAEAEALLLESLLTVTDSLLAYRQRYRTAPGVGAVLDLLLYDEANPRAVAFQLVRAHELIARLPRDAGASRRSPEERVALEALSEVRLSDPAALTAVSEGSGSRRELDGLLARVQRLVPRISDAVTAAYFRHEEQPHPMQRLRQEGG